ncbi:MAG: oxygen-independent coproporphyrinogen III oxidase [Rhizobiales bacterium]|nr:oxygen-independent coproporphyrinogen III oxidase [Hyphomicrobiales bacterium]
MAPKTPSLIELAGRAVPRYTSYPTAPHFHAGIDGLVYRQWLAQLSPCTSLSLYLHVPFCAAMCSYCGCHTKVVRRVEPVLRYRNQLTGEIDLVASATVARKVRHLHWGGGTPSMLGAEGLAAVIDRLALRFDLADDLEHAIELDPRHVSKALAADLRRLGVSRASLGVQDFNPHVQAAIGRVQPYAVAAAAVDALREAGIAAISFDLMYGLPGQSAEDVARTIERAVTLAPDRIALFGYAHVPWFKTHQRLIDEAALPDAATRLAQEARARGHLLAMGYEAVGLDHFALPGDAMARAARDKGLRRNFQGYATDSADALIGLGASAIGQLPQGFVQNATDLAGYGRAIEQGSPATTRGLRLSPEDRLRAKVIGDLMCAMTADLQEVADRFHVDATLFDEDIRRLAPLTDQGLVSWDGRRIGVPEAGRPYLRLVASAFDAHLAKAGRHSRAV